MQADNKTALFFLEDEAVLFHEPAQKLFHLNTVAGVVWCLLEDGKDEQSIASELQNICSISATDADRYLNEAEALFRQLGVLQDSGQSLPDNHPQAESAAIESAHYGAPSFVAERRYRLLNSRFSLRFTHQAHVAAAEPVFCHLRDKDATTPTVALDIVQDDKGRTVLYRDQVAVLTCDAANQFVPLLKSLVWQTAILAREFFLDIHAGVVGDGKQCFLLPAAPGSGKSTLTATLVYHGFEYFSDEVALLHGSDFLVEPVPLAFCVKHTGVEILAPYFPELERVTEHLRGDGKRVRYMPPPAGSIPPFGTMRPVGAIIFPRYLPDQATTLKRIGALEALELLMQECLIVDTHLDTDKVSSLLRWIGAMPCYRLSVVDVGQAVELIKGLSIALR